MLLAIDPLYMGDAVGQINASSPLMVEAVKGSARDRGREPYIRRGADAIVRVHSLLERQESWLGWLLGSTLYSGIVAAIEMAEEDPSVQRIVLDVDSPGGYTTGAAACAERIAQASKPTVAFVSGDACSCAYFLASAAESIVAVPSAAVANVGVFVSWTDYSAAMEQHGVQERVIRSSLTPLKALSPNTAEGQAQIQARVDAVASEMLTAIGRYRGIEGDPAAIAEATGFGDVMTAEQGLARGLIDAVAIEVPAYEHQSQAAAGRPLTKEGLMANDQAPPATDHRPDDGRLAALEGQTQTLAAQLEEVLAHNARLKAQAEAAEAARLTAEARQKAAADESWIGGVLGGGGVAPWLEPVVRAVRIPTPENLAAAHATLEAAPAGASVPVGATNRMTHGGSPTSGKNAAASEMQKAVKEAEQAGMKFPAYMAQMRQADPERARLIEGGGR